MSPGPLRRLSGTLGLLVLVPTAVMLVTGNVTPGDAALRAGATLLAAMVVGRVAAWWVGSLARSFEREDVVPAASAGGAPPAAPGTPQRRRTDRS